MPVPPPHPILRIARSHLRLRSAISPLGQVIYFVADEVASQMELPYTSSRKSTNVDVTKMLRRVDKLTAAQV